MERSERKSITPLFVIQTTLEKIFEILNSDKFELYESDGMVIFRMYPNVVEGYTVEDTKRYCFFILLKGTDWQNRVDVPLDVDPKEILGLVEEAIKNYRYPPEKS